MAGDDQTFGISFSSEGIKRLRERVMEKLKVFMGDYTDDTLVEYVIVLLKNGRHKDEAKSELNVFLGDDSDSFVSWLWDHLGSNLNLYAQPQELPSDGTPKTKYTDGKQTGKTELQFTKSEAEKGSTDSTLENYRTKKLMGLVKDDDKNETPIPKKSMTDNIAGLGEYRQRVDRTKQSLSPRPKIQKKRRRTEERQPRKREVSQPNVSAPRRLLQFAVRDAVGTSMPRNSTAEPSLKRLRSVVSTSTENSSLGEHPQRIRKVARLRTDMSAAIKAVSDAVKDVTEVRPLRKVFDRLGRAINASNVINHRESSEDGDFVNEREGFLSTYNSQNDSSIPRKGYVPSLDNDTVYASNLGYVGEGDGAVYASNLGYIDEGDDDDVDALERGGTVMYWSGTSVGNKGENSEFQYGATDDTEKRLHRPHKELDQHTAVPSSSFKIASAVKMNVLKPPQYREIRDASGMDNIEISAKSEGWLTKEKSNAVAASNGSAKPGMVPKHDPQKTLTEIGLTSTCPPTEDTDSRTVFVSNVHFAATKDSLTRHFNKSGEVLKVNILCDPSTGQPKGSAYIEFTRKEGAENALSLDGTSFMSRILKIVRKTSAQPEAASVTTWPRIARASPFVGPTYGRVPFPRGIPSLYRPRIPIKPGSRSFQWKRESTVTEMPNLGSNSTVLPSTPRSLTYVRTEPKTGGSSGTA